MKKFIATVGRLFSLWRIGYKRPPFLLWQRKRENLWGQRDSVFNFFGDVESSGREISGFKLTWQSLEQLKKEDIPKDIITKLEGLKNRRYINEDEFLGDLRMIIGNGQSQLERLIFDQAAQPKPILDCKNYELTEQSLKLLEKEKYVSRDIITKLRGLKDQEYAGKHEFLDALRRTIGEKQTDQYELEILERAAVSDNYSIYLWPDGLRWHFLLLGLIFCLLFAINSVALGLFALLWMVFIIPFITFRWWRIPVLDHIWPRWPQPLERWLKGIIQYGYDSPKPKMGLLKACLPDFHEPADAVCWSPNGSEQGSFLRAAMIEMFPHPAGDDDFFFHETAFKRFVIYWCSPIWGALSFLSILLALNILWISCKKSPFLIESPENLILPIIVWLIYSTMFFIWREADQFRQWTLMNENDYRFLPPVVQPIIGKESLANFLTSPRILTVSNFLASTVAILYLMIIEVISTTVSISEASSQISDILRLHAIFDILKSFLP